MNNWKYLKNDKIKITCKSETHDIGNSEYYGCCKYCPYVNGSYGDHWSRDKIWCSCPIPIKKGESVEIVEIKKYRKYNISSQRKHKIKIINQKIN
jgi:hypothetical protein